MQLDLRLAFPLNVVFALVAAPSLLGKWLSDVVRVDGVTMQPLGIGDAFPVVLQLDGQEVDCTAELIAYEPPAVVAYRFFAGPRTFVLRLDCDANGDGTRLRVHHTHAGPLAVDRIRLEQALA